MIRDLGRKPFTEGMARTLIESLWRNPLLLYKEKATLDPEYDELGELIDPYQKNIISPLIKWGQALGQDNLVEGNRSIAIGQSNNTKSYLEIVCGVYATAPSDQNATEWVPSDRLFTVGNGTGDALRNDALTIYKSGYSVFTNSILVGDYDHRDEVGMLIDPLNGTLRFTTAEKYQFWDVDHWASFGGSGITGSGTTGYLPKFTSSTSIGDSPIYAHGTDIAIGSTDASGYKLKVSGNVYVTQQMTQNQLGVGSAPISGARAYINTAGDAVKGLVIRANSGSQTANLQEWQNNSGTAFSVIDKTGNLGIGQTSPTAYLHIKAGTATANTSPLKFTAGTNLATTEAGAIEYDGTHLYFTATNGGTRYQLDQQAVSYTLPVATTTILGGVKQGSGTTIAVDGTISVSTNYQAPLSGTGFVKISGTTISYDNSTYDNYSGWMLGTGSTYRKVEKDNYINFTAGTNITIADNGVAGTFATPRTITISASGGTMVYPSAGLAKSTGSAWDTSITDNSSNWNTAYSLRIATFTTTGSSGAATFSGNTLNIPTYTLSGLGGIGDAPSNGTTYGRLNGAWSAITAGTGTVTSVAMSVPTGFSISGTPITTSGALSVTMAAGYFIPTTAEQTNWNEAYSNMGKVAFHDNFTLIGYLNSTNFSIAGGVISLKLKTINSTSLIGIGDLSLQPTLVSGTNIKTINGNSILGSGDITITGGTNYWQTGTGWIAPATITDEVRIGATTDLGAFIFQVSGNSKHFGQTSFEYTGGSINSAIYIDSNGAYGGQFTCTGGPGALLSATGYEGAITKATYSSTNSAANAFTLMRTTSGTPANNIGVYQSFKTSNSVSGANVSEYGRFGLIATVITQSSESGKFSWSLVSAGTMAEKMTLDKDGVLTTVGGVLSSGGAIGYTTGAGSTATQGTSKATAVTCNALCGQITTFSAALAAAAEATFVVNNSQVLAGDVVIVNHVSGGTTGAYLVSVTAVESGSFTITYSNVSTASKTEAPVFRFAIFRAVTA